GPLEVRHGVPTRRASGLIATFSVFAFMSSWNALLWPLVILRQDHLKTLPLALASLQGQFTTQWDVMMAGTVISILPMLALYIFADQKSTRLNSSHVNTTY